MLDSRKRHRTGGGLLASGENYTGIWRFGVYEVDPRKLQLRRSGVPVKLREQSFRILIHLLEHPGEIVTREGLRNLLWPADTFVDFDHSLNTAVMKLRGVLGDLAGAPIYIETIPKRGYRFIAPVAFVETDAPPAPPVEIAPRPPVADNEFSIAVQPFNCTGSASELASFAQGLAEEIVAGLSHFPYLRVKRNDLDARYVLDGTLRQAGSKLRSTIRLVDSESANLCSETFEQPFAPDSLFDLQDYLVPRMVSTVADARGILPRSISAALRNKSIEQLTPGEAVLRSLAHFQQFTAEEHAMARAALEHAIQLAPDQSVAWALLSLTYKDEFAHGFNPQPESLNHSLASAQIAIELDPSNHLAHHALAASLYFRKEFPAFRTAALRAIELNPMDAFSIASLGFLIAYSGEWDLGCALAERAHDLNPHQSGWYWLAHLFNACRKEDYAATVDIGLRIDMPNFWHTNVALAAAYGQLGDFKSAHNSLRALETSRPGFSAIAQQELSRWWEPALVDRLLDGLRKARIEPAPDLQPKPQAVHPRGAPAPVMIPMAQPPAAQSTAPRRRFYLAAAAIAAILAIVLFVAFAFLHHSANLKSRVPAIKPRLSQLAPYTGIAAP